MNANGGTLKRTAYAVLAVVFFCTGLFAKPKEKVFNNTPQEVFQAALRTARERHVVTYVDEKNLMLTFETGTSAFSAQPQDAANRFKNVVPEKTRGREHDDERHEESGKQ